MLAPPKQVAGGKRPDKHNQQAVDMGKKADKPAPQQHAAPAGGTKTGS